MSIEPCAKCGYVQMNTDHCDPYIGGVPYCNCCAAEMEAGMHGGWQPIETAPKDGSYILATGRGYGGKGERFIADVKYKDGAFCAFDVNSDGWTEPLYDLSHWMPIPAWPNGERTDEAKSSA